MPTPHRGVRCGLCYWALYDGHMCQNRECPAYGSSAENLILLSYAEATVLITAVREKVLRADVPENEK